MTRIDDDPKNAAGQRAATRSWAMTRGFIGGGLLLAAGLGFTLLLAAFLENLTIARNDQAGAHQPWLDPSETRTQALHVR